MDGYLNADHGQQHGGKRCCWTTAPWRLLPSWFTQQVRWRTECYWMRTCCVCRRQTHSRRWRGNSVLWQTLTTLLISSCKFHSWTSRSEQLHWSSTRSTSLGQWSTAVVGYKVWPLTDPSRLHCYALWSSLSPASTKTSSPSTRWINWQRRRCSMATTK